MMPERPSPMSPRRLPSGLVVLCLLGGSAACSRKAPEQRSRNPSASVAPATSGLVAPAPLPDQREPADPRVAHLVSAMKPGALKERLKRCAARETKPTSFSIGHRGAPMRFPEHTEPSYRAAAKMGAGLIECDVTFTKDRQLVCRHSPCDLAATTDILNNIEFARRCSYPVARSMPAPGT